MPMPRNVAACCSDSVRSSSLWPSVEVTSASKSLTGTKFTATGWAKGEPFWATTKSTANWTRGSHDAG